MFHEFQAYNWVIGQVYRLCSVHYRCSSHLPPHISIPIPLRNRFLINPSSLSDPYSLKHLIVSSHFDKITCENTWPGPWNEVITYFYSSSLYSFMLGLLTHWHRAAVKGISSSNAANQYALQSYLEQGAWY